MVQQKIILHLKTKLFESIVEKHEMPFFDTNTVGNLMSRLTSDTGEMANGTPQPQGIYIYIRIYIHRLVVGISFQYRGSGSYLWGVVVYVFDVLALGSVGDSISSIQFVFVNVVWSMDIS